MPTAPHQFVGVAQRVVADSCASSDGSAGRRTARTTIPEDYARLGWGAWQAEEPSLALFDWLATAIGGRVGWSQAGFTRLARQITQERGAASAALSITEE